MYATIEKAFHQFTTYKDDISTFFTYNALMVISDGQDAKLGTITGGNGSKAGVLSMGKLLLKMSQIKVEISWLPVG